MIFGKWITDTSKAVIEEESTGRWTNVAHGMKADYWIIDVDETNYSWSVIGQRNLSGYWIMSREKTLD
jgi:lipocalin